MPRWCLVLGRVTAEYMSVPGIDIAIHTNEALLSTGAWMDFASHVRKLSFMGKHDEARRLWDSVFEVVHLGIDPSTPVLQQLDMPPIRRVPCCCSNCERCSHGRGGFKFPFIGVWTRRAVFPRDGATVAATWDRYHATPDETMDLLALNMLASGSCVEDFAPPHMDRLVARMGRGEDGVSLDYVFAQWRFWCLGTGLWREPAFFMPDEQSTRCEAGRFLRLLLGANEAQLPWIPPICVACSWPRFSECPGCGTHWCDECRGYLEFCPYCEDSSSSGSV